MSPFNYIWKIPIVLQNPQMKSQTIQFILDTPSATITVPGEYTIINPDHSLFYRVNYHSDMLRNIKNILRSDRNRFTAQDRTGFISDQFSFAAAGITSISSALDILIYIRDETDFFPWNQALQHTSFIHSLIEEQTVRKSFGTFVRNITEKMMFRTGWHKPRTANEGSLQLLMIKQACSNDPVLRDPQKITEAKMLYESWMNGTSISVRPSLVPVINDCAIAHGPDMYWEFLFGKLKEGVGNRDDIMTSLTATTNPIIIRRLLNQSMDEESVIKSQDVPYIVEAIAVRSEKGRMLCWDFIKNNWSRIIKVYGNELYLLGYMLHSVLETFSTQHQLDEAMEFFRGRDLQSGSQAYKQAQIKIRAKIRWKERHIEDLRRWLEKEGF